MNNKQGKNIVSYSLISVLKVNIVCIPLILGSIYLSLSMSYYFFIIGFILLCIYDVSLASALVKYEILPLGLRVHLKSFIVVPRRYRRFSATVWLPWNERILKATLSGRKSDDKRKYEKLVFYTLNGIKKMTCFGNLVDLETMIPLIKKHTEILEMPSKDHRGQLRVSLP